MNICHLCARDDNIEYKWYSAQNNLLIEMELTILI